jgi:DNA-binding NarL/FixJ family response regulator
MPLTVAVVEDDSFTRTMLVATLRAQGVDVVVETGTPVEALQLVTLWRPHVAVLDLHLGAGPTGIELAHALRAAEPRIALVLLTSFEDPRLLSTRLPDPPPGTQYVAKGEVGSVERLVRTLKDAVEAVPPADVTVQGHRSATRATPTSLAPRAASSRSGGTGRVVDLTDSQLDTLQLLAQGLSNAEIARRRSVTERSVETTISRTARALGLAATATHNQRVHMAKVYFRALGTTQPEA